jgi:multisubunit Na+/H+ antiporter MnhB subunit
VFVIAPIAIVLILRHSAVVFRKRNLLMLLSALVAGLSFYLLMPIQQLTPKEYSWGMLMVVAAHHDPIVQRSLRVCCR